MEKIEIEKAGGKIQLLADNSRLHDNTMIIKLDISKCDALESTITQKDKKPFTRVNVFSNELEKNVLKNICGLRLKSNKRKIDGLAIDADVAKKLMRVCEDAIINDAKLEEKEKKQAYENLLKEETWKISEGCDTGIKAIAAYCNYKHQRKFQSTGDTWTNHCRVCNRALQKCKLGGTDHSNRTVRKDEALKFLREEEKVEEDAERRRNELAEKRKIEFEIKKKNALAKAREINKPVWVATVGRYDADDSFSRQVYGSPFSENEEAGYTTIELYAYPSGETKTKHSGSY